MLVEMFKLGQLWDEYGLIGDVVVSPSYHIFMAVVVCTTYSIILQLFTSHFPHTDIHELLTLGLLHQLIKGAFKVHIITWIVTYIDAKHMKRWANQILNDIDHWWVIQFQFFFYLHNAD